ncbi:MAG: tetratricopeptide repeat protein [Syntrophaceae bacterium]
MKKGLGSILFVLALFSPVQADYMQSLLKGDHQAALEEMRSLAVKGDAKAQYDYALMFETGLVVNQNQAEAAKWYKKSAAQGYPYAENNLGVMYEEGRGVERDYAKAVDWYRQAARRGLTKAQYSLGRMYAEGRGVNKDPVQAYVWLSLAESDKELTEAKEQRDKLAKRMTAAQMDQARKLINGFKPTKTAK